MNNNYNLLLKTTFNLGIRKKKLSKDEKIAFIDLFNTPTKRDRITSVLGSLLDSHEILTEISEGFKHKLCDKPFLMIYGQYDPVKLLGIPKRLQKMVNNIEYNIIKGEAHFPHESSHVEMSEIIENWINKFSEIV